MPKIFPLTPSLSYVHVSFFPPCCPFQYLILSSYSISFLSLCFLRVHCDAYLSLLCPISFISLNVLPIFLFPLCSSLSHTHIVMPTYLFYVLSLLFIWISVFPIFLFPFYSSLSITLWCLSIFLSHLFYLFICPSYLSIYFMFISLSLWRLSISFMSYLIHSSYIVYQCLSVMCILLSL